MLQKNDQTKDTNRKSKYWQKSENVSIIQKITNMGTENWHNRQKNQLTNTEKYLTNQTKAWTKKNTQAKKTNKSENPPPKKKSNSWNMWQKRRKKELTSAGKKSDQLDKDKAKHSSIFHGHARSRGSRMHADFRATFFSRWFSICGLNALVIPAMLTSNWLIRSYSFQACTVFVGERVLAPLAIKKKKRTG